MYTIIDKYKVVYYVKRNCKKTIDVYSNLTFINKSV